MRDFQSNGGFSIIGLDRVTIGVSVALLADPAGGDADIRQVRVGIVFGGERLFPRSPVRQEFSFFAVSPFHAAVLEPNLYLETCDKNE